MQLGFDFASLEARIQGHYVLPFTDGEALAQSLIAEKPNDCFDIETEILTPNGWIKYTEITPDTRVASWSPNNKEIVFVKPTAIIRRDHEGAMIRVLGNRLDMLVTPGHRVVLYNRDLKEHITIIAKDLKAYIANHPNCFIPSNGYKTEHIEEPSIMDNVNLLESCEMSPGSGMVFRSYNKEVINNIVTSQVIRGSSSMVYSKLVDGKTLYQTTVGKASLNTDGFKLIYDEISETYYNGRVWCVSVPSTYVMVRRNSRIFVSGNCHSINAQKLGITRDNAKSFSYATMYGAQPEKLAKMLRIPSKEAERLFVAYWEAVPALKELKDRVEAYWKKTGKQYILGIDGRKLFVRSQHSLVNLLFQSAGAVCVKYTLVGISRRLEELNMLGDPLVDTPEDMKNKVYQMIAYHKLKTLWY